MNIIILTAVRLLGDGLAACFSTRPGMNTRAVVNDLSALRKILSEGETHVVLIDVTQGVDLFDVRPIAAEWPDVALVALGLNEHCLLYTSPSPRDRQKSRMPSSA